MRICAGWDGTNFMLVATSLPSKYHWTIPGFQTMSYLCIPCDTLPTLFTIVFLWVRPCHVVKYRLLGLEPRYSMSISVSELPQKMKAAEQLPDFAWPAPSCAAEVEPILMTKV